MSLYSRLDRLAADVEKLDRKVDSVSNSPQAQRTSIEAGTMDVNDEDGNLISTIGFQEDGSGATRFFDGPIPPVPAGFTALADGPLIQGTWDGTFEDGAQPTYDLAYLEVAATLVEDSGKVSFATISAKEGASATVVANQTGQWAVAVRSVSQAGKKSEFFSAGTVEIKITDLSGAIEAVRDSANGKNKITWSLRAPTSEDLGAVGDTWWVNEARTREDGSAYLAIIAQYQYQSKGWVQVEMAHEVIASVDLGTATVGELDGIRIMSQTIGTEQLRADFADFVVARGGTFITTNNNGEFSDRGLFFQQPDGTAVLSVPTDGGPISLSASDTQIRRAQVDELEAVEGTIRSGGTFTLAAGVTPPASPPELNAQWQRTATLTEPDVDLSFDWTGLAYWDEGDGHWVRGVNVLGTEGDTQDAVELYSITGEFEQAFLVGLNPRSGVTVIGDIAYVVGPDYVKSNIGKQWCHGFDLRTGLRVTRWEFVNFFAKDQKKIAIGNDGTNLLAAGVAPNGILYVFRYNPSTGAQPGPEMTVNFDTGRDTDIYGVGVSGGKYYVSPAWQVREYTVSGSSLNWTGFAWDNPNKSGAGFVWKDSRPCIVDGSGAIYAGSGFASDATVQACFAWFDGTSETTPSPVATVSVPARNAIAISMAKRAGLQKRLYVRKGTTGLWLRETLGENVTSYVEEDGNVGLYQLPTVNTFPNSTPAILKSANNNFEAKGDGSGRWGPLTFNADGTLAGIQKMAHGSVVVTPTADNTTVHAAVTFPEGLFTTTPNVVVSADSGVPGTNVLGVSATNISSTSFNAVLRRTNATASRIQWIAMGD